MAARPVMVYHAMRQFTQYKRAADSQDGKTSICSGNPLVRNPNHPQISDVNAAESNQANDTGFRQRKPENVGSVQFLAQTNANTDPGTFFKIIPRGIDGFISGGNVEAR